MYSLTPKTLHIQAFVKSGIKYCIYIVEVGEVTQHCWFAHQLSGGMLT